ncbi:MAG: preprotein translocase subunit SecG [Magnetospirillum sp. WYHS-4]
MTTVILVIHLLLAIGLVGVILIQRSEGGALSGLGGGMSGFMTGRSTANLLTRATAILAAGFFATSIVLAMMANHRAEKRSILDVAPAPSAPAVQQPAAPVPAVEPPKPAEPAEPSAPVAK